jgi:hypothetical protein
MKKKVELKKLNLNKEKIASLTTSALQGVIGGNKSIAAVAVRSFDIPCGSITCSPKTR